MKTESNNSSKPSQVIELFTDEQIFSSFDKPPILASTDYLSNISCEREGFQIIHPESKEGKLLKGKLPFAHEIIGENKPKVQLKEDEFSYESKIEEQAQTQIGNVDSLKTLNLFEEEQVKIKFEYKNNEQKSTQEKTSNVVLYDVRASSLGHLAQRYSFNPTYFSGGLENTLNQRTMNGNSLDLKYISNSNRNYY